MANFKKGDIVILKSGGPPMTVKSLQEKKVICVWWDEQINDYKEREFDEDLLEKYEIPEPIVF